MSLHRFRFVGPRDAVLEGPLGSGAVTGNPAAPLIVKEIELHDEPLLSDLVHEMGLVGWERDDDLPIVPSLLQVQRAKLSADAGAISPTAWTDVLSVSLATDGGTTIEIDGSCSAGVTIGGGMRLLINGGAYSNQALAESDYPALSGNAPGRLQTYLVLAASTQTYTIKLQASALALGSVTPRAGASLIVKEFAG